MIRTARDVVDRKYLTCFGVLGDTQFFNHRNHLVVAANRWQLDTGQRSTS
ncbi:MAG: hypothetical protein AAF681_10195 [Pseudomonadota bacterium]